MSDYKDFELDIVSKETEKGNADINSLITYGVVCTVSLAVCPVPSVDFSCLTCGPSCDNNCNTPVECSGIELC